MRTRGPKPTPNYLKLVTGSQYKNSDEAVVPVGIPVPPIHLEGEAQIEWDRICVDLYEIGILTKVDRAILALYCQAWGRWVSAELSLREMARKEALIVGEKESTHGLVIKTIQGNVIQNPILGIANKAGADCARYATDLGLTPSSRSRIKAAPPNKTGDAADRYFG